MIVNDLNINTHFKKEYSIFIQFIEHGILNKKVLLNIGQKVNRFQDINIFIR